MPTGTWTKIVIGLAAAVSAGIVWVTGGEVDSSFLKPVVTASSVVILLLLAFDLWIWRWPWVAALHRRSVLHGTWKTELYTSYPARSGPPIECYMVVNQTYSRICVRMLFDRSKSKSMSGDLVREDGGCSLYYVFRSDKFGTEPDTNPHSRGAAVVTVGRKPTLHMEGDYWMDVATKGRLETAGHSKVLYETFKGAQSGAYTCRR